MYLDCWDFWCSLKFCTQDKCLTCLTLSWSWYGSHTWVGIQVENLSLQGRSEMWKIIYSLQLKNIHGLPWWRSGWESACRCRGRGFEPWSGKIPHAADQLGPWATIAEPVRLEPVLRNKRGCDDGRPAHRDEEWPPLATTGESPRTETRTQHSQNK